MNYNLQKTIGKTLKENTQLEKLKEEYKNKYNKNLLYDFSLLEKHITDQKVITEIKNQCMKNIDIVSRFTMVYSPYPIYQSFNTYSGNLYFKAYTVYDKEGKKLYAILQLVRIQNLAFSERQSIYNNWQITGEINECIARDYEIEEIELKEIAS